MNWNKNKKLLNHYDLRAFSIGIAKSGWQDDCYAI